MMECRDIGVEVDMTERLDTGVVTVTVVPLNVNPHVYFMLLII